jgi:hypothetical protein
VVYFFRASLTHLFSNSVAFIQARWHKRREASIRNILGAVLVRHKTSPKEIFLSGLGTCSKVAGFCPNYAKNVFFYTIYNLILGLLAVVKSLIFLALSQNCEEAIGFVMSVCPSVHPSVCPHGTNRLLLDRFS